MAISYLFLLNTTNCLSCCVVQVLYHFTGEFRQIASVHIGTLRRTCAEVAAGEVNGGGGKSMGPRRQGDGGNARGDAPASPLRTCPGSPARWSNGRRERTARAIVACGRAVIE